MSLLTDVEARIAQARETVVPSWELPWASFAEFFKARVYDRALVHRTFLSFYDECRVVRRVYTYGEFGVVVERVVSFLHDRLGLNRGDRLATVLFNHDLTVIVYFAAWTMGIAVVPINVEEPTERKRYILQHSEVAAVLCWQEWYEEIVSLQDGLPSLREVVAVGDHGFLECKEPERNGLRNGAAIPARPRLQATRLDDVALIIYTSGTTGPPKGVILTAGNLLVDADAIAVWHGFSAMSRLMCVLPIHHVNGIVVTLVTPFYCKGSTVLNRRFRTGDFWTRVQEERVTCVSVVPTLLEFLLDAKDDGVRNRLEAFDGFICGAGPLLKDTVARFDDRFHLPIYHGYGLSETTCYACFLPHSLSPDEHRRWLMDHEFPSIGIPLRHNLMTILNEDGTQLPERERGEICIRGATVCAGYLKREDANAAAFECGWFRSGDEGFYLADARGRSFFFISGRLKELIIRGGVNISPLEIDDALRSHPGVQFAMAVPFEHRYYGEEIAAYIVPKDADAPPTEGDLAAHCRTRLPFSKRPKVLVMGREIPYTSTGKPKRLELKAQLAARLHAYRDIQFRDSS
ncbi:AMP-dependent ligase [Nitrospira sp.]|nr:AMP-dependent ligase [Nitrospira sp.]